MRKYVLWIYAAILIIGSTINLTACSSDNDNRLPDDNIPCIGIAWRADIESEFYPNAVKAIEKAGGKVVMLDQVRPKGFEYDGKDILLPKYTDENGILLQSYADIVKQNTYEGSNAETSVANVDAVVFTGGEDIAPTLYRIPEPWHGIEEERDYNATRDVSDYLTMMYAIDRDMPVMGMCRGMQMLATVSGATMIQDIPVWFDQKGITYTYIHRNQKQGDEYRDYAPHNVTVSDHSSILYTMSASETIVGAPSWHHQAVGSVEGTALKVTGYTFTDGFDFIEAIERTDKRFCIGLQFHPEASVVKYMNQSESNTSQFISYDDALRYFQKLIDEVKERKTKSNKHTLNL